MSMDDADPVERLGLAANALLDLPFPAGQGALFSRAVWTVQPEMEDAF